MASRGIYRIHRGRGFPNEVQVEARGAEYSILEQDYRNGGFQPLIDLLPWQEDYFAEQEPAQGRERTQKP